MDIGSTEADKRRRKAFCHFKKKLSVTRRKHLRCASETNYNSPFSKGGGGIFEILSV